MIHVHGGSVVLAKIGAARLPGACCEWTDVVCQGPTPAGLGAERWREVRAAFLEGEYGGGDAHPARVLLTEQDATLDRAQATGVEIVLWFSADWFCQAILLCLLSRLDPTRGPLTLVSLGAWPGVDDGRSCILAFLSAAQLREAFTGRIPVTAALAAQGRRAWDALLAPDPRPVAALVREGLPHLPFAVEGLQRHLEELPAPATGVNRSERHVLEALATGPAPASDLFPRASGRESRKWITDVMFAATLRRLAGGAAPLVALDPPDGASGRVDGAALRATRGGLTPLGRAVLDGRQDWIAAAGIDRWVGGVRLTPDNVWRWDAAAGRLHPPS